MDENRIFNIFILMHAPKLKPGTVSSRKNHISTKGMLLYFWSAVWKQHKTTDNNPSDHAQEH
jgi:hypothetical protein